MYVMSAYEVFEQDDNEDELVDTLQVQTAWLRIHTHTHTLASTQLLTSLRYCCSLPRSRAALRSAAASCQAAWWCIEEVIAGSR